MKRVITLALALFLSVSLFAISASAESYNPMGGCKTETTIYKANAADVVKDGVIGENEYVEIDINRDPDATDCMLGFQTAELFQSACDFLQNVHFYLSWDEVNGLNVGVSAELLETPWNATPQPDNSYYGDQGFPGDEFLFQFGMMFRVSNSKDETVMNRGISINTETKELLIGHYNEHGYTGTLEHTPYEDFNVVVNGNVVTYEISFPIEAVVPASSLNGKAPVDGTELRFDVTATGGSQGEYNNGANMYCVSLGDAGYLAQWNLFEDPAHAKGYFTSETIVKGGDVDDTTAPDSTDSTIITDEPTVCPPVTDIITNAPTQSATTQIVTDVVTSYVEQTDGDGNVVTDGDGNAVTDVVSEVITSIVTETPTQAPDGNKAPITGDPALLAAVAAVISACGVVVAKKRK